MDRGRRGGGPDRIEVRRRTRNRLSRVQSRSVRRGETDPVRGVGRGAPGWGDLTPDGWSDGVVVDNLGDTGRPDRVDCRPVPRKFRTGLGLGVVVRSGLAAGSTTGTEQQSDLESFPVDPRTPEHVRTPRQWMVKGTAVGGLLGLAPSSESNRYLDRTTRGYRIDTTSPTTKVSTWTRRPGRFVPDSERVLLSTPSTRSGPESDPVGRGTGSLPSSDRPPDPSGRTQKRTGPDGPPRAVTYEPTRTDGWRLDAVGALPASAVVRTGGVTHEQTDYRGVSVCTT